MAKESAQRAAAGAQNIDGRPFIEANSEARSRYGRFNLAIIGGLPPAIDIDDAQLFTQYAEFGDLLRTHLGARFGRRHPPQPAAASSH